MIKKILLSFVMVTASSYTLADVSKMNKDRYIKSCIKQGMTQQYCGCQYNTMNPILSKKVGKDWAIKAMTAKDMDVFGIAIEAALKKCV